VNLSLSSAPAGGLFFTTKDVLDWISFAEADPCCGDLPGGIVSFLIGVIKKLHARNPISPIFS
jgi:hypothetical protein